MFVWNIHRQCWHFAWTNSLHTSLHLPSSYSQPRYSRSILLTLNLQGFTPKGGGFFARSLMCLLLSCCKSPVQEAGCVPVTGKTFLATKHNCTSSKVGVNIPTALSGKYFGLAPDVMLIQWLFWDKMRPSRRGAVMPPWMREGDWLRTTGSTVLGIWLLK